MLKPVFKKQSVHREDVAILGLIERARQLLLKVPLLMLAELE